MGYPSTRRHREQGRSGMQILLGMIVLLASNLCSVQLQVEEPCIPMPLQFRQLSFQKFEEVVLVTGRGEWVEIKGFLHRSEQGELLLVPQPALRSCCTHLIEEKKILLLGSSFSEQLPSSALSIRGFLLFQPEGEHPYVMRNSTLKETSRPLSALQRLMFGCAGWFL